MSDPGYMRSAPLGDYVEHAVDPGAKWLRPVVAFDFETHPFRPGCQFPRLVCASFVRRFARHKTSKTWGVYDDEHAIVYERARALPVLRDILSAWDHPWHRIAHGLRDGTFKRPLLVNQEIGFDLGVVCAELPELLRAVINAYRAGDVRCTSTREKGRRAALGTMQTDQLYRLDVLADRYLGLDITASKHGPDKWRARYNELEGMRAEDYPQAAYDYSQHDPEIALGVFEAQALACATDGWHDHDPWLDREGLVDCPVDLCAHAWPDEAWQVRAAFWLRLVGGWGMAVDPEHVFALRDRLAANVDEAYGELLDKSTLPSGARIATALDIQLEDGLRTFAAGKLRKRPSTWQDDRWSSYLRKKARAAFGLVSRKPNGDWKSNRYVVQARVAAATTRADWTEEYCSSRDELLDRCAHWRAEGVSMSKPSATFPDGQPNYGSGPLSETGDVLLEQLASVSKDVKELGTYIPHLVTAAELGVPVNPSFNVMVANGRTSAKKPPVQQPPRRPGIRESNIPRPGNVYVNSDLDGAELCTLAQICLDWFGASRLADDLNAGRDPHLGVGAEIIGISYEEAAAMKAAGDPAIKPARAGGKSGNFGAAGGLGEHTFAEFAHQTFGLDLVCDCKRGCSAKNEGLEREYQGSLLHKIGGVICASFVLAIWKEQRPIVSGPYFDTIAKWCEAGGRITLADGREIKVFEGQLPRSGRIRGGLKFTAGCNNYFSGPVADGAKRSGWWIMVESYLGDRTCDTCRGLGYLTDDDMRVRVAPGRTVSDVVPDLGYTLEQALRVGLPCTACDGSGDIGVDSELDGFRQVNFLHDEHMLEGPEERAPEAGERVAAIMIRELEAFTPGVRVGSTPWNMDRWRKSADEQRDADGRLTTCRG